ncbi:MAG: Gldg family protein [Candidatus Sumerlaeia bacterium]
MRNRLISIAGIIVIILIVLAVNLIAMTLLGRAKVDMTEEKLFTLSKGSKKILSNLDDNITVKFYFSKTAMKDLPVLDQYATRVLEMLREYEAHADDKFELQILDPRPDTETEEWAERYGLQSLAQAGERLYLGLVLIDESGNEEVIPFFMPDREPMLEYEITKAIYTMSRTEKKNIGVISSLDITGGQSPAQNPMMQPQQQQAWVLIRELRNNYNVEKIEASATEIPDDVALLLIVHPKELSDDTRYAIDQYVMRGGRVVAFVDPLCDIERQQMQDTQNMQMMMQASFSSNMPDLLEAWGVRLVGNEGAPQMAGPEGGASYQVVADSGMGLEVPNPQTGERSIMPVYLQLNEDNRSDSEIITSGLENLVMLLAGELEIVDEENEDVTITPLMESSDEAVLMDDTMLRFMMDPAQIQNSMGEDKAKRMLACKITGKIKSAFPNGNPADADSPTTATGHLSESQANPTIIVVSDVDMISDRASVRIQNFLGREMIYPFNDNLYFLTNCAENLTGSDELISLRSRGKSQRPFDKVSEIQQAAQERWRAKEEELNQKLQAAEQRLNQLQQGTEERQVLSAEFTKEINQLREERRKTSKELREVRRQLREDVEALGFRLKFINIALVPIIVIAFGLGVAVVRFMRRRNA